ncbi:hypothetical protein BLNAU_8429 [Blattamonas nauphoetae]|uniref:Uncharacterized protein n=1 Tax=Blattamonas nauphoetae TaxID=2049346 RepID=A0ABQ9XYQ5_9EUKA|nr:hypothetical protein BLNAU_8429 [Blattamonas nauphoetae]
MQIVEELKQQLADVPIWVGTESLQTLDRTAHRLTPTTLTQIVRAVMRTDWRTAFTHPIDEGEWELKIRASDNTFWAVMLGFLRRPLPENATQKHYSFIGTEQHKCCDLIMRAEWFHASKHLWVIKMQRQASIHDLEKTVFSTIEQFNSQQLLPIILDTLDDKFPHDSESNIVLPDGESHTDVQTIDPALLPQLHPFVP